MKLNKVCEACKKRTATIEETCDDLKQPYKLCESCHERLINLSLKPIEWYNLAVTHSPNKYLLHDDFYEKDGEACQPEEEVTVEEGDEAPTLAEVQHNLENLLDFSVTRWFLEEGVIVAFKEYDNIAILESLKHRFRETHNYDVKARMLEVAADVLATDASEWTKELWENFDEEFLYPISWLTATSLPIKEGLPLVLNQLEQMEEKKLATEAFNSLYRFRSAAVLDWMESHCTTFHSNWGRLASLSQPTWNRMKEWLNKGRPLSLIALDTMENCIITGGDYYVEQASPKILKANKSEIKTVLQDHYKRDSVPRVRMKVDNIIENQEEIFN
ncbi:hypothetical protein U8V72_25405 [Priestia filamentosa]|uniref:hypothetical protein n=1 Tax=Priestia filamentosa TaxID=1402861 RepID=UPI003979EDA5